MVLSALELLRRPTRDKTNEYMRYTLRLKPFWGLSSPEILPFESFQQMFTIRPQKSFVRTGRDLRVNGR